MNFHYKAFIAVIVITALVFIVLKPLFLRLMGEEDFALRRNLWLYLTVTAFLSPDYWLFFFLAVPALVYAARKDSNPAALYLFLLLAVPPVQKAIPTLGLIGQVFDMDHLRVMSLTVLLPTAIALSTRKNVAASVVARGSRTGLTTPDMLVLGFALVQLVVQVPHESLTNSMRRLLLMGLDLLLPYFVLSRGCRTLGQVKEAVGALAAAAIVLCLPALLEMFWASMLFGEFEQRWGSPMMYLPLYRGELLRAQATAGHSIVFGNFCAIALCAWWTVKSDVANKTVRTTGGLLVLGALFASLARGPWLGAFVGALTIAAIGRGSKRGMFKAAIVAAVIVLTFLNTPYGDSVIQYVPFLGTAESDSVTYRQRLLELSLTLIADNPFFGTPGFIQYMESLRQGQGIIDLVNGHMTIALSFGLVGLALYLGIFGVVVWRCAIRPLNARDEQWRHVGVGIGAAIVTAMVILFTASNYLSVTYLYWSLAGLGCGLMRLPMAAPAAVKLQEAVSASHQRGFGRGAAGRNRSKWAARAP
jgi:hypothetical protein